jgi:hypothetical protein
MDANIDRKSELKIARLCMMQAKSPEIDDNVPGYQQGMIVNAMTREILSQRQIPPWLLARGVKEEELAGKEVHACLMLPVFKLPREFIKWIKREDRKDGDAPYEFKTLDGTDPRVRAGVWKNHGGTWGIAPEERKKAPPVTINCNILFMPISLETGLAIDSFVIGTFAKTSADCGQVITTAMENCRVEQIPPWGRAMWLYTKKETWAAPGGKTNTAFVYQATRGPLLKDIAEGVTKREVEPMVIGMVKALMDKQNGVAFQQMLLNASDLDGEEEAAGTEGDAANHATPAAGDPDPFTVE